MFDGLVKGQVLKLVADSDSYRNCTFGDIDRCVWGAVKAGKAMTWFESFDMVGLMTWARLTHDKVQPFVMGQYTPGPEDFNSEVGELWCIDFLAPYGGATKMVRDASDFFANKYGDGTVFQWKRTLRKTRKLGYAVARKSTDVHVN